MKKYLFFLMLFIVKSSFSYSQVLTGEENRLYQLIMEYRAENGLPRIPISTSLTLVAQTHVRDLQENFSDQGECNMHSWSDKGNWSSCCYTPDHAQSKCMWNKPRELTSYSGNGYEIAFGAQNYSATAQGALNGWKQSSGHNAVIMNEGIWKSKWNAIGIGIYRGYAVVWFGNESDD